MTAAAPFRTGFRIALASLGDVVSHSVEVAIERLGSGAFVVVSADDADAFIIDSDRFNGSDGFASFRRDHPRTPAVIISSTGLADPHGITLTKPIGVAHLMDALRTLRERFVQSTVTANGTEGRTGSGLDSTVGAESGPPAATPQVGRAEDPSTTRRRNLAKDIGARHVFGLGEVSCARVAPELPHRESIALEVGAEMTFDPHRGALGIVQQAAGHAREYGRIVALSGLPGAVYIDRSTPLMVLTDLTASAVRAACFARADAADMRYYTIAAVPQSARRYRRIRLDSLVWSVALWSSRGRLPRGVDPWGEVQLAEWPNFPRLAIPPHALRIAARWVGRPAAPVTVAAELHVPQCDVFAFFSAASALGLVGQVPRAGVPAAIEPIDSDTPIRTTPPDRRLLSRIVDRLFHAH